ncbi:hypothetical protein BGZ96_011279 [Linnemannia gamsii]|uniref:Extracellular membrane protein CFEM domain-containing protein n=1 Tax=Linnemannia gamsii TaxID=64522 RepID=A0ABQ7JSR2_9FUNG|nr:hypothetical protein BGZ96_011279 [Linnemannia gamsii]
MKIQFLTIATVALAASTVSAFSCPNDPTHTIGETCLSTLLEAANCNCYAYASVGSGNCWGKCQLAGKYKSNCIRGCSTQMTAEQGKCERIYQGFKKNGGGLDWAAKMGVKKGNLC